jgi:hypothetical protein
MKILYHHVVATPEQSSYYYAERFNPPYLLVSPYGDGYQAGFVSGFNHRQEFIEHPLGEFSTKELATDACIDEAIERGYRNDLDDKYEQGVRDRYVLAGLGNVY